MSEEEQREKAKALIGECYKSFLDDDYNTKLNQIISLF
jgi:hypothetical protein